MEGRQKRKGRGKKECQDSQYCGWREFLADGQGSEKMVTSVGGVDREGIDKKNESGVFVQEEQKRSWLRCVFQQSGFGWAVFNFLQVGCDEWDVAC